MIESPPDERMVVSVPVLARTLVTLHDLTHQALERQLAEQQVRRLLVPRRFFS